MKTLWRKHFSTSLRVYAERDRTRAPIWNMTTEEIRDQWRRVENKLFLFIGVLLLVVAIIVVSA